MSRKPKKYHYIYKTTCKITGKFYVGMHSSDSLDDGYLGSGKILGYSRKKYGDENHVREILEMCSSRDELKQREKEIVNEALLADPLNINLKYGGDGGWTSLAAIKGNTSPKRDHKTRVIKMKKTFVERNKLLFGGNIGFRGFLPNWTGRKHSEEAKQKMRKTKNVGASNSQYGIKRVGICKDGKIRKVLPEQLQEFLDAGWKKGFR